MAEAGQGLELKGKFDEDFSMAGLTLESAVDAAVKIQGL